LWAESTPASAGSVGSAGFSDVPSPVVLVESELHAPSTTEARDSVNAASTTFEARRDGLSVGGRVDRDSLMTVLLPIFNCR
jgi:hypothetical protein